MSLLTFEIDSKTELFINKEKSYVYVSTKIEADDYETEYISHNLNFQTLKYLTKIPITQYMITKLPSKIVLCAFHIQFSDDREPSELLIIKEKEENASLELHMEPTMQFYGINDTHMRPNLNLTEILDEKTESFIHESGKNIRKCNKHFLDYPKIRIFNISANDTTFLMYNKTSGWFDNFRFYFASQNKPLQENLKNSVLGKKDIANITTLTSVVVPDNIKEYYQNLSLELKYTWKIFHCHHVVEKTPNGLSNNFLCYLQNPQDDPQIANENYEKQRNLYLAIFIPIGVIVAIAVGVFVTRTYKKKKTKKSKSKSISQN